MEGRVGLLKRQAHADPIYMHCATIVHTLCGIIDLQPPQNPFAHIESFLRAQALISHHENGYGRTLPRETPRAYRDEDFGIQGL